MFAVGIRCVEFPSTQEANCYFEEEMATTFREGQSIDTHFWQWLVSIYLHSNFALEKVGLRFVLNLEQPHSFSKGVNAKQGTIRDA